MLLLTLLKTIWYDIYSTVKLFVFPFRISFKTKDNHEWLETIKFSYAFQIVAWLAINSCGFLIRLKFACKDLDQEMLHAMTLPTLDEKMSAVSENALAIFEPQLFLSFVRFDTKNICYSLGLNFARLYGHVIILWVSFNRIPEE
jgi:hypothetical protein